MLTMTMTMPVSAEGDGIPDNCHKESKQKTKLILGMVISFSLEEPNNLQGKYVDSVAERWR